MDSLPAAAKPKAGQKGKLLRILGVSFGIAVTLGSTIGVGILRTPGGVAAQLGNFWLIMAVWAVGGVYALFGTIAVTELATALPQAGGWYVYARRAFGEYVGFTIGWINWFSYCTAAAAISIAMAEYAAMLVPASFGNIKAIAVVVLVVFTLLHWFGLRLGSHAQELMSFAVALSFVVLVVASFIVGGRNTSESIAPTGMHAPATLAAIFVAFTLSFQSVLFTYDGWYGAIYFAEEDKDPSRNLPRSMISAVLLIIAIYLLVNLALLYVLPLSQLAASRLAAADAAKASFGAQGGLIITMLAFISLVSVTNAGFMQTPRILYGMSRDGLFLSSGSAVNYRGTPSVALIICSVTEVLLVMSGTFEKLLAVTAFFWVVMYGSGFVSLIVLRTREPDLARPFKAWGYPWTISIVVILSFVFLVGVIISDTANSLYGLLVLVLSYPAYLIVKRTISSRLLHG
jgi:basic amino acid/polyamine antiporter, APA family